MRRITITADVTLTIHMSLGHIAASRQYISKPKLTPAAIMLPNALAVLVTPTISDL